MTPEKTLRSILGSETTNKSVHAQAILEVLKAAPSPEERSELLAIALVELDSVQKHPRVLSNKGIQLEMWEELNKSHIDMINGYLKMAFFKSRKAKDFAAEILKLLELFDTEDEKTFALAASLYSDFVPFYELPGVPLRMTDHQYNHLVRSHADKAELIKYIVKLPFHHMTEEASMLLQVLDDVTDRDLRVALLALYIDRTYKSQAKALQEIAEKLVK